jgi:hypothetical protein
MSRSVIGCFGLAGLILGLTGGLWLLDSPAPQPVHVETVEAGSSGLIETADRLDFGAAGIATEPEDRELHDIAAASQAAQIPTETASLPDAQPSPEADVPADVALAVVAPPPVTAEVQAEVAASFDRDVRLPARKSKPQQSRKPPKPATVSSAELLYNSCQWILTAPDPYIECSTRTN